LGVLGCDVEAGIGAAFAWAGEGKIILGCTDADDPAAAAAAAAFFAFFDSFCSFFGSGAFFFPSSFFPSTPCSL
jgi:hypothetical protein